MWCRRRGFSLVELSTALAIIALMLALLFPVLRSAIRFARRAAAMERRHQNQIRRYLNYDQEPVRRVRYQPPYRYQYRYGYQPERSLRQEYRPETLQARTGPGEPVRESFAGHPFTPAALSPPG